LTNHLFSWIFIIAFLIYRPKEAQKTVTHEDSGKYALKHPPGTKPNELIAKAIREKSPGRELACGVAEEISKELKVNMSEVGIAADLLEMKIKKCQLGLFGWGKKPDHGKDIQAAPSVSAEMKNALEEVGENSAITCASLWAIADRLGVERKAVSSACEALGFKIRACQLGTF
jgi:hypothetical protein